MMEAGGALSRYNPDHAITGTGSCVSKDFIPITG
jgi:hypothetical protein